jgi:hypothetical protein
MRAALLSVSLGLVLGAAACNGSETRSPTPDIDAAAQAATAAPGSGTPPVASGAAGGGAACTTDADCRTFGSYCADAPCTCKALAKSAPDPACSGTKVECFAAPCMGKAAACQGGRCELVLAH